MAGVSRLQYSTDIELIRVMCSGRVDLEFIFRAFAKGVDGVFVGGCRLDECNYITHGNYHALNMVLLCKRIMGHIGLNPDRLMVSFMSSGEGNLFAEAANDFSRTIAALGPLGKGEGIRPEALKTDLDRVRKLVPYIKIAKRDKLDVRLEPHEYEYFYTADEIDRLFDEIVSFYIEPEKCRACGICLRKCPVEAISGGKGMIHVIDQEKCIKCGTCLAACPPKFGAVREITGEPVPPPVPDSQRAVAGKGEMKQPGADG